MHFLNRLKYYLIGVGLGILLVLAIFKDRKLTNWTPKNQILNEIQEGDIKLGEYAECVLNCYGISSMDSLKSHLQTAHINFSKSNVKDKDHRKYMMEFEGQKISFIVVEIYPEKIEIWDIRQEGDKCGCHD